LGAVVIGACDSRLRDLVDQVLRFSCRSLCVSERGFERESYSPLVRSFLVKTPNFMFCGVVWCWGFDWSFSSEAMASIEDVHRVFTLRARANDLYEIHVFFCDLRAQSPSTIDF
jgi:hypothetical protein